MEQLILPSIGVFFSALVGWFFSRQKQRVEVKSMDIDNEVKSAIFYQNLLDDAMRRLELAIKTINEQDEKIKHLLIEIEHLTDELRKYKQLNGKHV
ncbi:cell wall anchor protein [Flavobacterium sp. '19STA2R22 D10 B1']|uniref:cell wall anchor protein n=1 Tax=Flavobacterium aerium TaxID=3037261 RepID=UPI00278BCCD6|nr:cell wall anchor protein [Flavobacterium sp. '19STA2R22 D10 B1']